MERIESRVNTASDEFRRNREVMEAGVRQLRETIDRVRLGGPEESRARHTARGKLLVRERIRRLLDPGLHFWNCRRWPPMGCTVIARARLRPGHRDRPLAGTRGGDRRQ